MKQITFFVMMLIAATVYAANPAGTWTSKVKMTSSSQGVVELTLNVTDGWHVYSWDNGDDGPCPMEIDFSKSTGVKFYGELTPSVAPTEEMDAAFGCNVKFWDKPFTLTRKFKITDPRKAKIIVDASFQGCNDSMCTPPTNETITLTVPGKKKAKR